MNFKPTYKTGGTTSRKPSKNDRAMVSGVSSILKKIKDKKNRKEVAGSMVKQFNREGVSYNKEKFLKNSRSFQGGGTLPPIYTSNPYDPRIRSYNDSLNLYKGYVMQDYLMGPKNERISPGTYIPWTPAKLREDRIKKWNPFLKEKIAKDYQNEKDMFTDNPFVSENDKKLIRYYKSLGFTDDNIMYHTSADLVHPTIRAVGTYMDGSALSPIYKKPVQPIIYEPLKPMGIKAIPATSPFTPITSVNIPMRKEKPLPVVRHTTNYLEPDIIKHRNLDEGFYKEIREELPKPKVTPGPKEIVPKQQPRKSNPKVVYQNYKKGGTVKSKEAKLSKLYKTFKLKK